MLVSLTFWSTVCLLSSVVKVESNSISTAGEPLREPSKIYVNYDGANTILYVRLCQWTVTDTDGGVIVNMTRYCYCTESIDDDPSSDSCTTPGPTLEMKSNTSINVTIVNQLIGSSIVYGQNSSFWNEYKDMDTTNLHVHGLHVSPFIDDILVKIKPSQWHNYTYDIPFHYPGTFWYHAHHHGSTTWQVGMGLHGVILMRSDDDMTDIYEETVLQFTWQYIIPFTLCYSTTENQTDNCPINPDGTYSSRFVLYNEFYEEYSESFLLLSEEDQSSVTDVNIIGNLADNSLCDIFCEMPETQRSESGYIYDVETDIDPGNFTYINNGKTNATYYPNLLKFFVNGQFEPVITDMKVGVFRRLRLINSLSNWYIQFLLPSNKCDWYLIATDGVFIGGEFMNYNLAQSTHNSQYLLGPGNRADIMVRCNTTGNYSVYATESMENDPQEIYGLNNFQRIYNNTLLFSFIVNEINDISNYTNQTELPKSYPEKPIGTYIEDLSELDESNYTSQCECNYANNIPGVNDECVFEFSILVPLYPSPVGSSNPSGHSVNLRQFEVDPDNTQSYPYEETSLTLLEKSKAYQFIINNDYGITYTNLLNQRFPQSIPRIPLILAHVYHQHINPFQVPNAIAGGFIALPKTWWDTMGNLPYNNASINATSDENGYITMRFWTRDYDGLVIVHCHLLQHEDEGMMGYFNILSDGKKVFANNCTNREYSDDVGEVIEDISTSKVETTKDSTDGGNVYMIDYKLFAVFVGVLVVYMHR